MKVNTDECKFKFLRGGLQFDQCCLRFGINAFEKAIQSYQRQVEKYHFYREQFDCFSIKIF